MKVSTRQKLDSMAPLGGVTENALGGALEGASTTARELVRWQPPMGSPDQIINRGKVLADNRSRDLAFNEGKTKGAINTHQDSIVGASYRLNAMPQARILREMTGYQFDEKWAEEFQEVVEALVDLLAESEDNYLDASGLKSLTAQARMAVAGTLVRGEVVATVEWLSRDYSRPCSTAIQMISPARLSNPNNMPDTQYLRRGVERDSRGKTVAFHIRDSHPGEFYSNSSAFEWKRVAARKPWGRRQVIHLFEQQEPDQSRGLGDIVAVLKDSRMGKMFKELMLQNAVVNASYAAALESEMPPDAVYAAMGGNSGSDNFKSALGSYLDMIGSYFGSAQNVQIDGAKIPVLPPGVKLNTRTFATPGGMGDNFEASIERNIAAALGMSHEEFSRNFSATSYSGLKASFALTGRHMNARKKTSADAYANSVYALVLEELIGKELVPLPAMPRRMRTDFFYMPLVKQAICKASWIGAGAGQIDELKETQAAILRVKAGFSTYERECARLGMDYRENFAQRAREEGLIKRKGLSFSLEASKGTQNSGGQSAQQTEEPQDGSTGEDE
jgi:lambda family phage portal protein